MNNQEFLEQLTRTVSHLSMLQIMCNVTPNLENVGYIVRSKGGIYAIIHQSNFSVFWFLEKHGGLLKDVHESMKKWLTYFAKTYSKRQNSKSKKPYFLTNQDAEKLEHDVELWISKIIEYYSLPNTVLIKEHSYDKFLPFKLRKGLGRGITSDLKEGFELLGFNSPTAASMILLRASEGIIKKYYKEITQEIPRKKLSELINDLEKNHKLKKSTFGYLHYIREKRNDALHPGKTFKQEEAERVLINVKGLLEEIK